MHVVNAHSFLIVELLKGLTYSVQGASAVQAALAGEARSTGRNFQRYVLYGGKIRSAVRIFFFYTMRWRIPECAKKLRIMSTRIPVVEYVTDYCERISALDYVTERSGFFEYGREGRRYPPATNARWLRRGCPSQGIFRRGGGLSHLGEQTA